MKLRLRNIRKCGVDNCLCCIGKLRNGGGLRLGSACGLCTFICRPSPNGMHVHETKKWFLQLHRNDSRYVISSPVGIKYSVFMWGWVLNVVYLSEILAVH